MTAALQLSRGGVKVDVFESGSRVGGLSRSLDLWGQRVDLGPHRFFSADPSVRRLWLDLVGSEYAIVNRLTRIYYRGRFLQYPLKPLDVFRKLGLTESSSCLASYLKEKLRPGVASADDVSFESWIVRRFGRRLFETFFRAYSEKLWDIPCDELSADFAAQRIKRLSVFEAVKSALSLKSRKRHKTLVERFQYPLRGAGAVYESMADRVCDHGGRIHLECPVERILHGGFDVRGVKLRDGREEHFDHVVSTMPLTDLVRGLTDIPADVRDAAGRLRFRNTIFVYLHIDSDSLFDDQWLYIHDPDLKMGRVTNFRNWVPQLHGGARTTILTLERWCNDSDPIWTASDEHLIEQAIRELRMTTLLGDEARDRGARRPCRQVLSRLSLRLSPARRANCRLSAPISWHDPDWSWRDVQIQQSRSQYPDGHAGGRSAVGRSRPRSVECQHGSRHVPGRRASRVGTLLRGPDGGDTISDLP